MPRMAPSGGGGMETGDGGDGDGASGSNNGKPTELDEVGVAKLLQRELLGWWSFPIRWDTGKMQRQLHLTSCGACRLWQGSSCCRVRCWTGGAGLVRVESTQVESRAVVLILVMTVLVGGDRWQK